jgi:hypothetical protein
VPPIAQPLTAAMLSPGPASGGVRSNAT